jgi:hypothetical protein
MATAAQRDKAAATITPRLLSRLQAAIYVGLSATEWDSWWKENGLRPIRRGRRVLWDRHRLDVVIDKLFDALDSDGAGDDPCSRLAL